MGREFLSVSVNSCVSGVNYFARISTTETPSMHGDTEKNI